MKEDDVWITMPSQNDWFAGWAKRMGELQTQAHAKELGTNIFSIIRPSAIFGTHDNFDKDTAMFIPAIISRIFQHKENPLKVWGDGSAIRDFLMAPEVAKAMVFSVENKIIQPLNVGSGIGISLKEVLQTIKEIANESYNYDFEIEYDITSENKGDDIRIFDISRIQSYGFCPKLDLKQDIKTTIDWFISNQNFGKSRFSYI
jgi:GDP-L-fucose synthase